MTLKKLDMTDDHLIVLCAVPDENTALKISESLVNGKLAACCNIIPGLRSIFFWEGKMCDEPEMLLIIKTKMKTYEKLEKRIRSLHPYDVPEVLAFPIKKGNNDYLKWIDENVE